MSLAYLIPLHLQTRAALVAQDVALKIRCKKLMISNYRKYGNSKLTQFTFPQNYEDKAAIDKFLMAKLPANIVNALPDEKKLKLKDKHRRKIEKLRNVVVKKIAKTKNCRQPFYLEVIHVLGAKRRGVQVHPILRVKLDLTTEGVLNLYIDSKRRIYTEWQDFLDHHHINADYICYPKNGYYSCNEKIRKFDYNVPPVIGFKKSHKWLKNFTLCATSGNALLNLTHDFNRF